MAREVDFTSREWQGVMESDVAIALSSLEGTKGSVSGKQPRLARKQWFVVYAKPRQELEARRQLERQGYTTFLPLAQVSRRRGGQPVDHVEALFPRYLFIRIDPLRDQWTPIASTIGVVGLVRFGERFARVPDRLINELKRRQDAGPVKLESAVKVGDKVHIRQGAAQGYRGVVFARSAQDRVKVLLRTAAGYTLSVNLAEYALERLAAH